MAQLDFDATEVSPEIPTSLLPVGEYLVHIIESELKDTKAGTGKYLELTMEVLDGEHKGRRLWERLNLFNPNPTAVSIAQSTLSGVCHAVGVMHLIDSTQLHNAPFVAKVKIVPEKDGHDASNEIARGGYKPAGGSARMQQASTPTPDPAASSTKPWAK